MRPAPTSPALTDAEAIAAMKRSVAGTGQCTIGEQSQDGFKETARVDTAAIPVLPGTDRVSFMKVKGKQTDDEITRGNQDDGVTSALLIELRKARLRAD